MLKMLTKLVSDYITIVTMIFVIQCPTSVEIITQQKRSDKSHKKPYCHMFEWKVDVKSSQRFNQIDLKMSDVRLL